MDFYSPILRITPKNNQQIKIGQFPDKDVDLSIIGNEPLREEINI